MKIKRLLIIIYLGPISNPMKLTAGFLSAGMKTLSLTFCAGGLKIKKNLILLYFAALPSLRVKQRCSQSSHINLMECQTVTDMPL